MITEPKGFIYDIHQRMKANNVLLAFTGEFDMKIINALTHSVKMKLNEVDSATKIQKRVYNIMVECLEAVYRNYEDVKSKSAAISSFALFTLSKSDEYYYIISGNYVAQNLVPEIKNQIDSINKMGIEDKKNLYRAIITNHELEKYNSDLALIDIAIKSNSVLEYDFKPINDKMSFYLFEVKIKID